MHTLLFFLLNLGIITAHANEEPGAGVMELTTQDEQRLRQPALLVDSQMHMKISGMVAMVEVIQTFSNTTNQWVEGRYLFPLPENAAVDSMELQIGERLIRGKIKEKQEAKKIYQEAKAAGKKAAILEQHRPNLFSQKVANIAPGEEIKVKLSYLQVVDYQNGVFSLRFPMTITPRYIPGQSPGNRGEISITDSGWGQIKPTPSVPDADRITPPISNQISNPIDISIQLDAGLPLASINSAYHTLSVTKETGEHRITLAQGKVSMDRDFVLSWQATASSTPRAAVFGETIKGDDYHLVMLMPPVNTEDDNTQPAIIPKEVLFIIDTSGSMGGTSIRQAKAGLRRAIQSLNPNDRFNIIEFNSTHSLLFQQPVTANSNNIQHALDFTNRLQADGGTEMLPALMSAFQQTTQSTHLKQIVFITDGSIGNEEPLFTSINQHLNQARLFTVGIGSAPNSFFMRKAAEIGRGSFTYIGNINEVDQQIADLLQQISTPMMQDIAINENHQLDVFPYPIADLYQGQPLVITVKNTAQLNEITIGGTYQNQLWEQTLPLQQAKENKGVSKLWARHKIEALLDQKRIDLSQDKQEKLKQAITNVALQHQLVSPYTSFVAVEEIISKPAEEKLKQTQVANQLAHGQTLQTVNYPQTATSLWLNSVIGLFTLAIAALLYRRNRNVAKRQLWSA